MSEQYGVTPHKPHELIESRYTMTDIRKNNNHKQT